MASGKSGSFELSTNGFELEVSWNETYSVEENTSYVSITSLRVKSSSWYGFSYYPDGLIKINGEIAVRMDSSLGEHSVTTSSLNSYSTVSGPLGGVTVPHNSDGSKTVTIEVTGYRFSRLYFYEVDGMGGSGFGFTGSRGVALTTIPRATVPKLSHSTIAMGSTMTVDLTSRASASFTHYVYIWPWSIGTWTTVVHNTSDTNPTFVVPDFSTSIPNSTSDIVDVLVETYSGDTFIGGKRTNFTATVPASYVPSISVSTAEGKLSGYTALIQGHSKVAATITASATGGASVDNISSMFEGRKYTGSGWTSRTISGYGALDIRTTVTDSRGRSSTVITPVQVESYSTPTIGLFKADRCTPDHTISSSGECARIMYSYWAACTSFGVTVKMTVKYKARTEPDYKTLKVVEDLSAEEESYFSEEIFSKMLSFDLQMEVRDSLGGQAQAISSLRSEEVIMDIKADGKGIAFGKISEQSYMAEFGWDVDLYSNVIKNMYGGGLDLVFQPAPGDDPVANSRALQELINTASEAGGRSIHIPAGNYRFGSTESIHFPIGRISDCCVRMRSNVHIYGDGAATVLLPVGQTEGGLDMFYFNDYREIEQANYLENCRFADFVIDAAGTSCRTYTTAGKGFMLNLIRNCHWRNVTVLRTDGTGIGVDCPILCSIDHCYADGCGKGADKSNGEIHGGSGIGIGYGYSNQESMEITNCRADNNSNYGIFYEHQGRFKPWLYGAKTNMGLKILGCSCQGNGYNYGAERATGVMMSQCYSNKAQAHGYCMTNSAVCTISDCISNVDTDGSYVVKTVPNDPNEQTEASNDIVISGCTSKYSGSGFKIYQDANGTASMKRITVTGNTVLAPKIEVLSAVGAIDNLIITGNNSEAQTLRLTATGSGHVIKGNSWDTV